MNPPSHVIAAETQDLIAAMDDATFNQWLADFDKPILPSAEPLVLMNDQSFKHWLASLADAGITVETLAAMDNASFQKWLATLDQSSEQFKTAAQAYRVNQSY